MYRRPRPSRALRKPPDAQVRATPAAAARTIDPAGTRQPEQLVASRGWRLRRQPLLRPDGTGLQAMLTSHRDQGFSIAVDPLPAAHEAWEVAFVGLPFAAHAIQRFRIAHEIGHTLFYATDGDRPRRSGRPSSTEERFCDLFAAALVAPDDQCSCSTANGAEAALDLALELECSINAVLVSRRSVAVAGHFGLGGDREPSIQQTWGLSDDPFLLRRHRALATAIEDAAPPSGGAFLAVEHASAGWSIASAAWTPEASDLLEGYDLGRERGDTG